MKPKRPIFILVFLCAVIVLGMALLVVSLSSDPDRKSAEASSSTSQVSASAVKLEVELQEGARLDIIEVKTSEGRTIVTFSNGAKAQVASDMKGSEFLKVGNHVSVVKFDETDGLPLIQTITPSFTPPGCSCQE